AEDYEIVVFVGGAGAYREYYQNSFYLKIAQLAKRLAAICIAPAILADSGIFKGKKVTSWNDQQDTQKKYLQESGAIFEESDLVIDGIFITANGPNAAEKFGQAILYQLTI
nr:DJ-1/PfpI family protein [Candidatus Gracilibacteria bacterium]